MFRMVPIVLAGFSVVVQGVFVVVSVISLMLPSSFRQVLTLSYGLLFSWSCLIFSWVVVVGVCDFENVKRYNVSM